MLDCWIFVLTTYHSYQLYLLVKNTAFFARQEHSFICSSRTQLYLLVKNTALSAHQEHSSICSKRTTIDPASTYPDSSRCPPLVPSHLYPPRTHLPRHRKSILNTPSYRWLIPSPGLVMSCPSKYLTRLSVTLLHVATFHR